VGDALADAFLGLTNTARLSTALDIRQPSIAYEGYAQDNYKVSRKLTLNLGIRYEFQTPYIEQNNRLRNFVVDPASPRYGQFVAVAGTSTRARSFTNPDRNNLGPRVGFAWQATGGTVVRGGYGVFYDAVSQMPFASRPTQNPPFYLQSDIPTATSASTSLVRIRDGFGADALNPAVLEGRSIAAVWPEKFVDGITHQWNLNIQRSLPGNSVFSAAYVGTNTAHRRLGSLQINQPKPGPGALAPRRQFPLYADVAMDVPLGTANYQGLELKFERRFTRGFSVLGGHTWSHAMIGDIGQDTTLRAPEKQLSPEDVRHRFFVSSVWDLPVGKGRRWLSGGPLGRAVEGWQLSPIFTAQTGLPFTPGIAGNPANTTGGIRPDRIRDGNLPRDRRSPELWFDPSAFAAPAAFRFGNSGANILAGPGAVNLDLMAGRTIRVRERWRIDFRAEFFNLLNEAHFLFPAATVNNAGAGAVSQTADAARQIQFGLKVVW
jgi:hypothetical protein